MSSESRTIQWLVWGGLLLVVTIVSGLYVRSEQLRRREAGAWQLVMAGQLPAFSLTNQTGQLTTLESLRGQVWLADVIFTRCPGAGP